MVLDFTHFPPFCDQDTYFPASWFAFHFVIFKGYSEQTINLFWNFTQRYFIVGPILSSKSNFVIDFR